MSDWKEKVGGYTPCEPDPRDYKFRLTYGAVSLPQSFTSDTECYVHNQGEYNNCAAHSLSEYIEIVLNSADKYKEISFPWFYGNRRYTENKEQGLNDRDLLKTAQKDGSLYLSDYSKVEEMPDAMYTFNELYPKYKDKALEMKIGNYYFCNTLEDVKEAIYKYGSVLFGTMLFQSFGKVATGETLYMNEPIIDGNALEPMVGGHMMILVGWDDNNEGGHFLCKNSWGEEFGDGGYFYVPYSLMTWNQRVGFPISVFNAWAIDGIYLDDKFISFDGTESVDPPTPIDPETPAIKDDWYQKDGKWRYQKDGKDVVGCWQLIAGTWYCFDDEGWMKADTWVQSNGKWCYVRPDGGAVQNNWRKIDNRWYWFDENCYAIKGYKNIDGVDYYFAEKYFGNIKECECMVSCK